MPAAASDGAEAESPRPETIEALFDALESPLLAYAQRLVPELDMAEDLVQEAFVRLHERFDEVRTPRAWLYRTVHNLALNHRREADKIVPFTPVAGGEAENEPAREFPDPGPGPDDQLSRWEGVGLVRMNLQNLDARSREIVRLKFEEDCSYQQISERTGLKSGHVGYLLHHAIKTLAADLARAGFVP